MNLNTEKMKRLVAELQKALSTLKEFSLIDTDVLLNDEAILERVKYNFIVCIQSAIDICNNIVAKKGERVIQLAG